MKPLRTIFIIVVVIQCYTSCLNAVVIPNGDRRIGDGIVVRVQGNPNHPSVGILRNGRSIGGGNVDGHVSLILPVKASDDGSRYNIAIREGTQEDLYTAFAVIGDQVKRSMYYRNTGGAAGDYSVRASWATPDRLLIGSSQPNELEFNPTTQTWKLQKAIIPSKKRGGIT